MRFSSELQQEIDIIKTKVFSERVLNLLLYDVSLLLHKSVIDRESVESLMIYAKSLCELDGFVPPSPISSLLYTLSILWISFCTSYKNNGYVYTLDENLSGLRSNKRIAQCIICSEFLNCLHAPPRHKIAKMYNYFKQIYGQQWRTQIGDDFLDLEYISLKYVLDQTGFSYCGPDLTANLMLSEEEKIKFISIAQKKLSF